MALSEGGVYKDAQHWAFRALERLVGVHPFTMHVGELRLAISKH